MAVVMDKQLSSYLHWNHCGHGCCHGQAAVTGYLPLQHCGHGCCHGQAAVTAYLHVQHCCHGCCVHPRMSGLHIVDGVAILTQKADCRLEPYTSLD